MSLSIALNNALSGLRLNQQSIGVLSHNIANVNTAGYSRQIVNQSAITIEGLGSGVRIDDVTRKIDKYLQRAVQTQGGTNASLASIDDYYQRIQNVLGQPGANNSLDSYMTGFFNMLQQASETPEVSSLRSNAITAGANIAGQFSDLAAHVYDLRFEADREIADGVDSVNGLLDKLYNLNSAINQSGSLGQSTAGLLDERDSALRDLSQYLDISVSYNQYGAIGVVSGKGAGLIEEGVRHRLQYNKAPGVETFVQDAALNALQVIAIDEDGKQISPPIPLATQGKSSDVISYMTSGKLYGLQQIRDVKFPAILEQLDQLASHLRDAVNKLHNTGSGFPPATVLTGQRAVNASDQYSWTGSVRIAVLKSDGKPVSSPYADESYTGIRPLTLNLAELESGAGQGKPTLQTIVNEINTHFGAPGNKVELGKLNNIKLVSDTTVLPSGGTSLFNFDLELENISDSSAQMFVTGMTVQNSLGANITSVTQTAPSVSIDTTNSYTTTMGSTEVVVTMLTNPNVAVGEKIYLSAPSAAVNGISQANLTGFFTVKAVNGTQITIDAGGPAASGGAVNDAGNIQAFPPYGRVAAGDEVRVRDNGQMQVDLTAGLSSPYYDITLNVSVVGADGVVHTSPITYRVTNSERDLLNKRYAATAASGEGTIVLPQNSQESLRAILVDENGNELPKVNGQYVEGRAYLKIIGGNTAETYSVAIDDLDSQQLGKPDGNPLEEGTGWGFSHYFGLNNFFDSNGSTKTGDVLHNSALNLQVQQRIRDNANLLSIGGLTLMSASAASGNRAVYTYARYAGDNSVGQKLAQLNTKVLSFDAAGGLPTTQLSLQSYTSEVLGYVSQRSAEATDNATNAKVLYDNFVSKSDAISGVNLDEELANTVILQNAYSATARVITTVNKMYDDLLQTF